MRLTEFSEKRAERLNKLNISVNDSPSGIRFLWFDIVTGKNIRSRIHTGVHTHSFYEIQIVFSGNVSYDCCDKSVNASVGYAILIPPNNTHKFLDCDENLIKGSIAFSVDYPWLDIKNVEMFKIGNICEDVNFILQKTDEENIFTAHIVYGRLLEIFYSLCKMLKVELPEKIDKSLDSRFVVAKKFIDFNCRCMINSEDVAKECGLSSKQLNRIFKQNTNMSLYEYIVDVRIKTALELLDNMNFSIKEIGFALGFETESGFVSFFKRHTGTSPGAYRKSCMSEN